MADIRARERNASARRGDAFPAVRRNGPGMLKPMRTETGTGSGRPATVCLPMRAPVRGWSEVLSAAEPEGFSNDGENRQRYEGRDENHPCPHFSI